MDVSQYSRVFPRNFPRSTEDQFNCAPCPAVSSGGGKNTWDTPDKLDKASILKIATLLVIQFQIRWKARLVCGPLGGEIGVTVTLVPSYVCTTYPTLQSTIHYETPLNIWEWAQNWSKIISQDDHRLFGPEIAWKGAAVVVYTIMYISWGFPSLECVWRAFVCV